MKSRISPKVIVKTGGIDKQGMFAIDHIRKGEIVFIKGGHIITREELFSSSVINSYMPISDDYFLGATNADEEKDIKLQHNAERKSLISRLFSMEVDNSLLNLFGDYLSKKTFM